MNRAELIKKIRQQRLFYLATVEEGAPRVRTMMLFRADEDGLVFNTGAQKDLHRQLQADPRVELCFHNIDDHWQIRVAGTVERIDNADFRDQVLDQFPFLRQWIEEHGPEALVSYRLSRGKARIWYADRAARKNVEIEI